MDRIEVIRWVKGLVVSAAAAATCYWIWVSLREWSQDAAASQPDVMFGGFVEGLLATITGGLVLMPLLLWGGMQLTRQRGNHLFVLLGALLWPFIGGYAVERSFSTLATIALLFTFAALTSLVAPVNTAEKTERQPHQP